jgi:glycosyltransferase 2 family protein
VTGVADEDDVSGSHVSLPDGIGPRRKWFDWRILPVVGITAVVMIVLVRKLAGTEAFFDALATARWGLLAVALALLGAGLLLAALRWMFVVGAMGYRLPLFRALDAMLATWPFALLTPARASDVLRAVAIADLVPPFEGAGSVLAEKAIDLQSLCLLTIVGSLLTGQDLVAAIAAMVVVALWIGVITLVRRRDLVVRLPLLRRKPEKVEQLLTAFRALMHHPVRLALVGATSLASWVMAMTMMYTLLVMMGAGVALGQTLTLFPAAILTGMVPLTLAGMGTRDAAFAYLLRATGWTPVREGALLAATFGYALVGTWVLAIVGIPFAIRFVLRLGRTRPGAVVAAPVQSGDGT